MSDEDERDYQPILEAANGVTDALTKLYVACDGDEAEVGEVMYEVHKNARRNAQETT